MKFNSDDWIINLSPEFNSVLISLENKQTKQTLIGHYLFTCTGNYEFTFFTTNVNDDNIVEITDGEFISKFLKEYYDKIWKLHDISYNNKNLIKTETINDLNEIIKE